MKIREVTSFDADEFDAAGKLRNQLDPGSGQLPEDLYRSILNSGNTHLFIGETGDGEIAGMITIVTYDLVTGKKGWIEDVVVDENQRGKGYGKELMLFAMNYCRSKGIKKIDLTSRPSRTAANRLYTELGFVRRETNVYRLG